MLTLALTKIKAKSNQGNSRLRRAKKNAKHSCQTQRQII